MNYYSSMDGLNYILQCRWNAALSTTNVLGVKEREFPNGKGSILDLYIRNKKSRIFNAFIGEV